MKKKGDKVKQKKTGVKYLLFYIKSHMWCSFALAILISILLLLLIIMVYMKNQYYKYLVDTTYVTENALLDSVNKNIETQLESFIDIGSGLSVDETMTEGILAFLDSKRAANDRKELKSVLQSAGRTSNAIVGLAIADGGTVLYQYDKNEMTGTGDVIWGDTEKENIKEIFETLRLKNAEGSIPRYLIVTHPMLHPNVEQKGIIHIAYPLRRGYSYKDIEYMLLVSYYSQPLSGLLKQLNENQEEYVQGYIEDETGEILLHTKGQKYAGLESNAYKNQYGLTDLTQNIGGYGWKLHAVIDEKTIQNKVDKAYNNMFFLYFIAIVVILLILLWVTNRILRPVNLISGSISRVKNGDIKEQIPIQGTNEIWQLAQSYNEMMKAIRKANQEVEEQHDQVIESMKMKQRAEREALESQINAHFICNTLNAINYEAIDSGNYKVSILLKKLSNILRYTFDQKHQNVYMFQEISWIEQYLFLQKERMDKAFDYEIQFDSDYDNWPCRKLMLQPFVENSILHGFEGMDCGGRIRITGQGYKEFLKISIEDNGCGMTAEKERVIQEILKNPMLAKKHSVGIGISNVITRMKMYYGKDFYVQCSTKSGEGTCFTFILPTPVKDGMYDKQGTGETE